MHTRFLQAAGLAILGFIGIGLALTSFDAISSQIPALVRDAPGFGGIPNTLLGAVIPLGFLLYLAACFFIVMSYVLAADGDPEE